MAEEDDQRFEWDSEKARENLRKHGVSFGLAARIFGQEIVLSVDDREDYGEPRYVALGRVADKVFRVTYTTRGERVIRLISAWRASYEDEEQYYREIHPQ